LAHFNACDTLLGKIEHFKDLKSSVTVSAATTKMTTKYARKAAKAKNLSSLACN
jgi:hypothetical protein